MYEALIVTNRMADFKRVLEELGLENHPNVLVKSKNQNTFDGLQFKRLILAPDFMIENDKQYELIRRLEGITYRYR